MPEPALTIWILGLPFALAIFELVRTVRLIRNSPNKARGSWSEALQVGGATSNTARPAASAAAATASGRRSSAPAPGLR